MASVVVPAFKPGSLLDEQLEALSRQDYPGPWELIVADNAGTLDGARLSASWRRDTVPLRVIDASDRRGVSHARNVGARAATGDFILVCDSDDRVDRAWVGEMVSGLKECDLVGGSLDRGALNDQAVVAWRGIKGRDQELGRMLDFLPYARGGSCGIRAEVFSELDGWNEDYVGGGDDVEFSWRAQLAGFRLRFVPDALVYYRSRDGLKALAKQFYRYGRALPRLYRDFRRHGARRRHLLFVLKIWFNLVVTLPYLVRSRETRGIWIRRAAFNLGMAWGSIRWRALCP